MNEEDSGQRSETAVAEEDSGQRSETAVAEEDSGQRSETVITEEDRLKGNKTDWIKIAVSFPVLILIFVLIFKTADSSGAADTSYKFLPVLAVLAVATILNSAVAIKQRNKLAAISEAEFLTEEKRSKIRADIVKIVFFAIMFGGLDLVMISSSIIEYGSLFLNPSSAYFIFSIIFSTALGFIFIRFFVKDIRDIKNSKDK